MPPDLNEAQRSAVATLEGPLLVLAGAGTGKTRVITYRIVQLIRRGIRPERILAVTFTNKAAREMQERAGALLGKNLETRPEISTFHSLCLRILRRHIKRLGYPERFSIFDRGDQETVARGVLRELRVSSDSVRPGELLAGIGSFKCRAVGPVGARDEAISDRDHLVARAYEKYQEALKASGAVDFDDLLLLTERLFHEHAEVREKEAARFDHILIDEYQDTNGTQYRIVQGLAAPHRNLCVVGDDDQSIYGWRGAEVTHILSFHKDWPEARIVRLEENYRSVAPILDLANRLIAHNAQRHEKSLHTSLSGGVEPRFAIVEDETREALAIVRDIEQKLQDPLVTENDFAILFRTKEQPRPFEDELRRAKIPYVLVGGMSFYDRREVRDVLAYLRVLHSPKDEVALLRILNTPPRRISKPVVQKLLQAAVDEGKPLWDLMSNLGSRQLVPANSAQAVEGFRTFLEGHARKLKTNPLASTLQRLIDEVDYHSYLKTQYQSSEDVASRWAAVEGVVNSLAQYEARARQPSLGGFLQEILLDSRDENDLGEGTKRRRVVTLMTLHSAKGLEFPEVYMVGMEEGLLPHHRAAESKRGIAEERRLCYVGITRARERLTLSLTKTRMKWGKPVPSTPSRFLFEMKDLTERRDFMDLKGRTAGRRAGSRTGSRASIRPRGGKARSLRQGQG